MLEGLQELGTEGSDLANKFGDLKVKLPVTLELAEDFDPTTIAGEEPIPINITTKPD
jgi:hypothetical protein